MIFRGKVRINAPNPRSLLLELPPNLPALAETRGRTYSARLAANQGGLRVKEEGGLFSKSNEFL